MNLNDVSASLEAKWRSYLEKQVHYIYQAGTDLRTVRSRNGSKRRYRWLLLYGQRPKRILSKSEQAYIHQNLRQAKTQKEATYLVMGFVLEPKRIIVIPADAALKAGYVRSDKGGIAWNV